LAAQTAQSLVFEPWHIGTACVCNTFSVAERSTQTAIGINPANVTSRPI